MALTAQEQAELEALELAELETLAAETGAVIPDLNRGINLGKEDDSIFRKAMNALDIPGSATRKAITRAIDPSLDAGQPEYKDLGQYQGFSDILRKMGVQEGPALSEALLRSGSPLGFALKALPESMDPSIRTLGGGVLDVLADPTLAASAVGKVSGRAARYAAPTLEKFAEKIYKMPFNKLDTILVEEGGKPISDLMYKFKLSGNIEELRNGLKDALNEKVWPKIDEILTAMDKKGFSLDPSAQAKNVERILTTDSAGKSVGLNQRPLTSGAREEAINTVNEVANKFRPVGYDEKVADYLNKFRGYLKEKKVYGKAGGNAEQGTLFPNQASQETVATQRSQELLGKDPSVAYAEPVEHFTQQWLSKLPTRPQMNIFNTPRGDDLLPLTQNMALDSRFKNLIAGPPTGYQAEILGLHPTQRTFATVPGKKSVLEAGQSAFAIPPQKPPRPSLGMNVWEALENKKDLNSLLNFNLLNNPNKVPTDKKTAQKIQSVVSQQFKQALEKGADDLVGAGKGQELADLNEMYGTALNALPELSSAILNKAGKPTLTAADVAYAANPHFRNIVGIKKAVEGFRGFSPATKTGKALSGLAEGMSKAKLNAISEMQRNIIPFYLSKNPNDRVLTEQDLKELKGE